MTDAMFSSPAPNWIPSAAVGMTGHVRGIALPAMPGEYGVCGLGAQQSVWQTPPGSQIRIIASAVAFGGVAGASRPSAERDNAAPAAAASVDFRNVRRSIET